MAVLLDTRGLPPGRRNDAVQQAIEFSGVPTQISHLCADEDIYNRMDLWQLGSLSVLRSEGSHLHLKRTMNHVRSAAPEILALSIHLRGTGTSGQRGQEKVETPGQLLIRDLTEPFEFTFHETCATMSVHLPYDELGLPADTARRAASHLASSPLYALLQRHLTELGAQVDSIQSSAAAALLGTATVELIRALISTAGKDQPVLDDAFQNVLQTAVLTYIRQNLRDPDLSAERIALAHHISVRQLYKLWSGNPVSLAQWIIAERLAGARAEIAGAATRPGDAITTIAFRWGFSDATHFSRRFSRVYGLSPRDWRRQQQRQTDLNSPPAQQEQQTQFCATNDAVAQHSCCTQASNGRVHPCQLRGGGGTESTETCTADKAPHEPFAPR